MKIKINNLGPIHHFEFDLSKDLNLIFGENNIGKSYAITAIYIILKHLTKERSLLHSYPFAIMRFRHKNIYGVEAPTEFEDVFNKLYNSEQKIIKKLLKNSSSEIDITSYCEKMFIQIIEKIFVESLEKSFDNSFESLMALPNKYSKKGLSIELKYKHFSLQLTFNQNKFEVTKLKFFKKVFIKRVKTNRSSLESDDRITIYFNQVRKKASFNLAEGVIPFLSSFTSEASEQINNVYFLPASRSGLYQALSTFSAVIAELSKSRNFLSNRIELPNISEPVSDYFLYLSNIKSKNRNEKYTEIVNKIEQKILDGKVIFNEESKKIVFTPSNIKVELDLSFTSSMISEIAPIVAFLKYIISDKTDRIIFPGTIFFNEKEKKSNSNLIFIEEPEAHLHPKIQVLLMELFSIMIGHNTKIVMTTHSNYMFNKLSNLILDKKVNHNKVGSYLMKMVEGKGSELDIISMKANREGIRDENFAETAEKLYEERINIYDKLNKNVN